eukprot:scaffold671185_cov38-Prasinocladus_malaysianus.AAC.1
MGIPFLVYDDKEAKENTPSSSAQDGAQCRFRHFFLNCEQEDWKLDTLMDLLETANPDERGGLAGSVVFANSPDIVRWLYCELSDRFPGSASRLARLHRGMSSEELNYRLQSYMSGSDKRVLVVDPTTFCNMSLHRQVHPITNLAHDCQYPACLHNNSRGVVSPDSYAPQLWIDFELPEDSEQHQRRLNIMPGGETTWSTASRILISLTCDLEMSTLRAIQQSHHVEELPDHFHDCAPDLFNR